MTMRELAALAPKERPQFTDPPVPVAPLATLAFLTILWLSAFLFADMFARTGSRILGALRGESPAAVRVATVRARPMRPATYRRPLRARPQLRAAA